MSKIKKCFGELNMTWPKVIIMAVITAVYTALINQVPALNNTSFQDIAINLECWILFAVFIIVNCKKFWEAMLKCFVFFLVSQPLIYLIEVPFVGWEVFDYYGYWFKVTLLTIPGAAVAFLLKRKDWLSVAVLSVATGFLAFTSVEYFRGVLTNFPYHLLSAIFCIALIVFFSIVLFDEKKHTITVIAIAAAIFIACFIIRGQVKPFEITLAEGNWSCSEYDDSLIEVEITDGNKLKVIPKKNGDVFFDVTNEKGETVNYYATVSGGGVYINELD